MPSIYPFTAIVGQDRLRRALILNAVHPQIGGVLIRGERGTAKSTAARALAALLPEIEVIADCAFGCNPDQPVDWCTECHARHTHNGGDPLPRASHRTRFIDLPVSATEDRVVGTLDIERAIQKGERHFEPGVLAAANRGVLYVDEVNLLDDHIVDILLDAAAMGVNVVEREGISFSHPARFILIGTMNPEEGDLRPQLLDRFALCVDIRGIREPLARMSIMERNLAFESDPEAFYTEWQPREKALSDEIGRARRLLPDVRFTRADLAAVATIMGKLKVDGHRADLVVLKAARAHAAFEGRTRLSERDLLLAAELALPHRLKRHPLEETTVSLEDFSEQLAEARARYPSEDEDSDELGDDREPDGVKKKLTGQAEPEDTIPDPETEPAEEPSLQTTPQWPSEGRWWDGGRDIAPGEQFDPRRLDTPLDRLTRSTGGRRSQTRTDRKRGRYIKATRTPGDASDLAFDATLRAAAPFQRARAREGGPALALHPDDYHKKVRVRKAANLVLFVVDASWSMAVAERMQATKGAVMSLLQDAYQRRDRVGVVVFQKNQASVVLPPTNSIELARRALRDIPVGGKTPLSAGLQAAFDVTTRELRQHPDLMPLIVLLTDGAGNVSMTDLPPQEEAHRIAEMFPRHEMRSIVINMEHAAFDQGLAQSLADRMEAPCYSIADLRAESLLRTVRGELSEQTA